MTCRTSGCSSFHSASSDRTSQASPDVAKTTTITTLSVTRHTIGQQLGQGDVSALTGSNSRSSSSRTTTNALYKTIKKSITSIDQTMTQQESDVTANTRTCSMASSEALLRPFAKYLWRALAQGMRSPAVSAATRSSPGAGSSESSRICWNMLERWEE